MYVRCPADKESISDPRVFVCGQIIKVDSFKKTVWVRIYDPFSYLPFFEDLPKGKIEIQESMVQRCTFFPGSVVVFNNCQCKVLSYIREEDNFYYYYLQDVGSKEVFRQCEKNIVAAFNNANMIEQRIGRLDRLERDPARPIVHSVVIYAQNTFEEALFKFLKDLKYLPSL